MTIISTLAAFLIASFLLLSGVAHCQSQFLGYTHCSQIDDRDSKQYCLDYINSNSADVKYSTAVLWSKYRPASFGCANITWSCLVSDLRAQAYGSSCTVAPNGSPCQQMFTDAEGSCWHGLCGDPAQVAVNMLLDKDGIQPSQMRLSSVSSGANSEQQQAEAFSNRRTAAQMPKPHEPGAAGFMQASGSQGTADPYDYDSSLLPAPGSGVSSTGAGIPGSPANDPYGLNVQLPDNPLISNPFKPPVPPPVQPPPPPPPPPPPVQRAQLTMDIQPDTFIGTVPASFLGVSREWGPQVYYEKNLAAFGDIFEVLGPAPIIRIGGASQESLLRPPNSTYLNSLKTLHCQLGIRYIIGLPLFQNAPELSLALKKTFDDAFKDYPFAILAYELGNEPNYWPGTGAGGVTTIQGATTCVPVQYDDPAYQLVGTMDTPTDKAGGVDGYALYTNYQQPYVPYKASQYCFTPQQTLFVKGTSSYLNFFQTTARSITGCGGAPSSNLQALWGFPYWGPPGFNRQVITGPAWGDFDTFDKNSLEEFLKRSDSCYLNELSLHYYGPNRNTTWAVLFSKLTGDPTAPQGSPARTGLITTVRDYVQAARVANVGLRVTESNSVPDGGQSGFSNTLGAALWTLVTALEFAEAGTTGIHFHWGNGGIPQNPGAAPAYIGVQAMFQDSDPNKPYPSVRVPWYGYVMFSRALGGNGPGMFLNFTTNALSPNNVCNQFVYPYALLVPHAGMISVVVANANPNVTCDFTATLPGVVTTGGVLQRLQGPQGLQSVAGVTLAGQTYQGTTDGKLQGTYSPEIIQPHQETIRTTGWTFALSPGSAALLQIPLSGGATNRLGYPPVTPNLVSGGSQQAAPAISAAYSPTQGITTTPPAGQAEAIQQMQAAAATAAPPAAAAAAGTSSGGNQGTGFLSVDAAHSDGSSKGLADGAGQYVLKGYAADGSAVYTWKAAAGSSYAADSSDLASDNLGAGFGQPEGSATTAAVSLRGFGLGQGGSSSRSSSGSRLPSSKSSGGLVGLLGGLFGRSGRKLLGIMGGALPQELPQMRSLLQWGTQDAYTYTNPDTQAGVSPYQQPAAASAASQFGAPAPSGIGRVWPQNSNTSNLDIGLYGLGGYTLLPPGYNQTAVAKAAAQCPGIARIMTIQSMADTRRKQ